MKDKEYVFIGTAQNKTRTYIKMLEEENREMKNNINKAIQKLNKYRNRKDAYCLWCMKYEHFVVRNLIELISYI